ncbi:MAG: thioesterase family protein [Bacteroidota bacterium]
MEQSLFKVKTQVRVRNYEVDWQGVVHNTVYLLYFEVGRLEYFRKLGLRINAESIQKENKVVLVRNEINYRSAARYNDVLDVYTRVSSIGSTSFVMEGLLVRHESDSIVGENVAVHVWLDPKSDRPVMIGDEFRKAVRQFEGPAVTVG